MIRLSNGHVIEYVVASGALAFDGKGWPWERPLVAAGLIKPELFTVVLKTLTLPPRAGYLKWWKPWTCVRLIRGGAVNKIGLTNPGFAYWRDHIAPTIDFARYRIVVSLYGTVAELTAMAAQLEVFELAGIEINPSCPNTGHAQHDADTVVQAVTRVKAVSRHPILVKLSVDQPYVLIACRLAGIAEAIDLNSVPWHVVFPRTRSPLWPLECRVGGGGGGVSGRPAQAHNWRAVAVLAREGGVPVIAPGIMAYEDMDRVRRLGASAVSFGTIHLLRPWLPTSIVQKEQRHVS